MNTSLVMILFSVVCGVCGQIALKTGMNQVGKIDASALTQPLVVVTNVASNLFVLGGLALYVFSAMVWLMVLSRVQLSFAYPIIALSYAFTPLFAWLLLGEQLPSLRWAGIGVICLGVFLVSRS